MRESSSCLTTSILLSSSHRLLALTPFVPLRVFPPFCSVLPCLSFASPGDPYETSATVRSSKRSSLFSSEDEAETFLRSSSLRSCPARALRDIQRFLLKAELKALYSPLLPSSCSFFRPYARACAYIYIPSRLPLAPSVIRGLLTRRVAPAPARRSFTLEGNLRSPLCHATCR